MEYGSNNFGAPSQTGNRMPSNREPTNWGQNYQKRMSQGGFGQSGFRPQTQARPQPQAQPQAQPQMPPRPAELYSQGRGAYTQPRPQPQPMPQPQPVPQPMQAAPQPFTRPNYMPPPTLIPQGGGYIRQGAPGDMMRRQVDPGYRYGMEPSIPGYGPSLDFPDMEYQALGNRR